jgi:mono/diheme cytochrome c family protein
MLESIPYDAQAENVNFPDGKTLQPPAVGTVARGYLPLHHHTPSEDIQHAGEELVNPISDTLDSEIEHGEKIFATFCVPCHGTGGLGDGVITKKGFPPPPSLMADKALQLKDGHMFHIVTYGQNNMPPLAGQVQRNDRWRVILYLRSLQKKAVKNTPVAVGNKNTILAQ